MEAAAALEILNNRIPNAAWKSLRLYHSSHRPGGDHYNSLTQGVGQIKRSKVGQTGWTNPSGRVQLALQSV